MSEMVERAAKMLAASNGENWDRLDEIDNTSFGVSRENRRNQVRVVAAALRDPTPGMLAAVDDMADDKYMARGRAIDAWQRMIDAALKETDDGREDGRCR